MNSIELALSLFTAATPGGEDGPEGETDARGRSRRFALPPFFPISHRYPARLCILAGP
ncbi:hypothetical protein [Halalkalicoccus salilacus]|uniref:hypothetical protein n=1 Tax=Halalkalicoccus salilacus TaxID=3117459 RepID=UPI00300F6AD0